MVRSAFALDHKKKNKSIDNCMFNYDGATTFIISHSIHIAYNMNIIIWHFVWIDAVAQTSLSSHKPNGTGFD